MKNKFGILLAALLTTAALSAHAIQSSLPASAETLFPLDANPAVTEEAMAILPGNPMPAKVGTSCPCNTKNQVIDHNGMLEVAENARKSSYTGPMLTGAGTSPIPANSAGGTQ